MTDYTRKSIQTRSYHLNAKVRSEEKIEINLFTRLHGKTSHLNDFFSGLYENSTDLFYSATHSNDRIADSNDHEHIYMTALHIQTTR